MQTKIPLQSYKTKLKIHIDPGLVKPCFEKPAPGNYRAQSIFFQLFSFQIYLQSPRCRYGALELRYCFIIILTLYSRLKQSLM